MAENLLTVENLSKTYGEKLLFHNVGFGINKGDKIGLVARNGEGKSTLLRLLMRQELPDEGTISFQKDLKIGYLEQNPQIHSTQTILENVLQDDNPVANAVRCYESLLYAEKDHLDNQNKEALQKAMEEMETQNAWNFETEVKEILFKLGLTQVNQKMNRLSGGEARKVALAKALLHKVDLLILDEPTNHLDIKMIEWLEQYLNKQNNTLLLVTHDRYFLDRVCNRIMEIDQAQIYKYSGKYNYFLEKRLQRYQQQEAEIDKAKNLYRKEAEWMARMPKARGTKAKARIDAFEELKEKTKQKINEKTPELSVKTERMGSKVLEVFHLNKKYENKTMVKDFSYTFKKGEKIGIVGGNGIGKTTLLNLLTQQIKPDSGKINIGQSIKFGYYTQKGLLEKDTMRVIDIMKEAAEEIPTQKGTMSVSRFLRYFGFPDTTQYNYYENLSGGEKRRLYLIKTLIQNPNFLILDEPTNDLDIYTLNILENFLQTFEGCLMIVSHDRSFLDNLVDHIFVFEGNGIIKDFPGNYSQYIEKEKQKNKSETKERTEKAQHERPVAGRKAKRSYKEQREWEKLGEEIQALSKEQQQWMEKLNAGSDNMEEITQWSQRIGEIKQLLDEKEWRWLELDEIEPS